MPDQNVLGELSPFNDGRSARLPKGAKNVNFSQHTKSSNRKFKRVSIGKPNFILPTFEWNF